MSSQECLAIEKDIDIVLSFLNNVAGDVSPFPPGWFERNLLSSVAFYASLSALILLVVVIALMFFVPRWRALWVRSRRFAGGYDALVEMDTNSRLQMSPKQQITRRDVECENLGLKLKNGKKEGERFLSFVSSKFGTYLTF